MKPITGIFQVIYLHLRSPCSKVDLVGKVTFLKLNEYYVTQSILLFIFSRWSLYVEVMDSESFTKQRKILWLTPFAFSCEWEKDRWKLQSENTKRKVQCLVHENNMKITVSVCWCPNKLAYGIAQLVYIYTVLYFWLFI